MAALEADLNRVRREAEKIRRDITQLREERAKLHARSKEDKIVTEQSQAQIRKLHQDIVGLQKKLRRHEDAASNHVCAACVPYLGTADIASTNCLWCVSDDQTLKAMQKLHREHCQSFMRRIHYLKARVTRESAFRSDLAYQKHHLLGTISCFERT